jgi:hypothetical protein
MYVTPPPAYILQVSADEVDAPADPIPIKIDISKEIPQSANVVTLRVTLEPGDATALIYAPGEENRGTVFKGRSSIDDVRVDGPILYIKLYGAVKYSIQYINYREP